jgi:hypothetical protein
MTRHRKHKPKIDYQQELAKLCTKYDVHIRHYSNTHPFCWNAKLHSVPYADVFERMCKEHYVHRNDALLSIPDLHEFEEKWGYEQDDVWSLAVDDMRTTFTDINLPGRDRIGTGGDTMRYVSPERYKKYHLKPNTEFSARFEMLGRSGAWLSLAEFEGVEFRRVLVDQHYSFMDIDDDESQTFRRKLCAYVEEVSCMIEHRQDELTYQLAFHMHSLVGELR